MFLAIAQIYDLRFAVGELFRGRPTTPPSHAPRAANRPRMPLAKPSAPRHIAAMAMTPSTMLPLGTVAPAFQLPNLDGQTVSLPDFRGRPLLVMFICNHCPFVKHLAAQLAQLGRDYLPRGVGIVAISANDPASHPEDSPARMRDEARRQGYTFPYLYDESQAVAKSYRAACTPDFFLFDAGHRLVYRGQFDDSRPGNGLPVTGKDLRAALDAVLSGQEVPRLQKASLGCNIKWKSGHEPDYYPA
jgi:peroxiredoxin